MQALRRADHLVTITNSKDIAKSAGQRDFVSNIYAYLAGLAEVDCFDMDSYMWTFLYGHSYMKICVCCIISWTFSDGNCFLFCGI